MEIDLEIDEETGRWIARDEEFGIVTSGKTIDQAKILIRRAVAKHREHIGEVGHSRQAHLSRK